MAIDIYGWAKKGDPIKGETQDELVKKDHGFDMIDFSFGVENVVNVGSTSGGLGSGRVTLDRFEFSKAMDTATTEFVLAACTGRHIDEFHFSIRKGGGDVQRSGGEFVHVTMKNVVVESVKWSGSEGDEVLNDSITLAFAGIKIVYNKQDFKGDLSHGDAVMWNQTTNKPDLGK